MATNLSSEPPRACVSATCRQADGVSDNTRDDVEQVSFHCGNSLDCCVGLESVGPRWAANVIAGCGQKKVVWVSAVHGCRSRMLSRCAGEVMLAGLPLRPDCGSEARSLSGLTQARLDRHWTIKPSVTCAIWPAGDIADTTTAPPFPCAIRCHQASAREPWPGFRQAS
jgi:hypothetical protein